MPGKVYAVELQADACALALRSVERNQLENTICIINNDINNLQYLHPPRGLDLVACNPPYKPEGTGIKNPQEGLSIARHEGACTFAEIAAAAARQLRWGGRFCCCLRPERLAGAMEARRFGAETVALCPAAAGQGPLFVPFAGGARGEPRAACGAGPLCGGWEGRLFPGDVADLWFV